MSMSEENYIPDNNETTDQDYQQPVYQDNQYQQPVYQDNQYQQPVYQDNQYQQPVYQDNQYQQYQQPIPQQQVNKSGCSGCLKGCLISLIVGILLVILLIFGGKSLIKLFQPKPVEPTQADIESFYEKAGIQNENYTVSAEELLFSMYTSEGQVALSEQFTSEEITGAIQDASKEKDVFRDISVKFIGPNQVEVVTTVGDQIEKIYALSPELKNFSGIIDRFKDQPILYRGEVTYDSVNGVQLVPDKFKVGMIALPKTVVAENKEIFEEVLNTTINRIEGLSIENLSISENGLDFEGTIPESLGNFKEGN